jgi:hypothetical protein
MFTLTKFRKYGLWLTNTVSHWVECWWHLLGRFDSLILTTDYSIYLIWIYDSVWVRPVNRGCLFLIGTWSLLWFIKGSRVCPIFLIGISYQIHETYHCLLYHPFIILKKYIVLVLYCPVLKVLQDDVPPKTCHLFFFFIFCFNHHLGVFYNI